PAVKFYNQGALCSLLGAGNLPRADSSGRPGPIPPSVRTARENSASFRIHGASAGPEGATTGIRSTAGPRSRRPFRRTRTVTVGRAAGRPVPADGPAGTGRPAGSTAPPVCRDRQGRDRGPVADRHGPPPHGRGRAARWRGCNAARRDRESGV